MSIDGRVPHIPEIVFEEPAAPAESPEQGAPEARGAEESPEPTPAAASQADIDVRPPEDGPPESFGNTDQKILPPPKPERPTPPVRAHPRLVLRRGDDGAYGSQDTAASAPTESQDQPADKAPDTDESTPPEATALDTEAPQEVEPPTDIAEQENEDAPAVPRTIGGTALNGTRETAEQPDATQEASASAAEVPAETDVDDSDAPAADKSQETSERVEPAVDATSSDQGEKTDDKQESPAPDEKVATPGEKPSDKATTASELEIDERPDEPVAERTAPDLEPADTKPAPAERNAGTTAELDDKNADAAPEKAPDAASLTGRELTQAEIADLGLDNLGNEMEDFKNVRVIEVVGEAFEVAWAHLKDEYGSFVERIEGKITERIQIVQNRLERLDAVQIERVTAAKAPVKSQHFLRYGTTGYGNILHEAPLMQLWQNVTPEAVALRVSRRQAGRAADIEVFTDEIKLKDMDAGIAMSMLRLLFQAIVDERASKRV